jgi:hypothetical protein
VFDGMSARRAGSKVGNPERMNLAVLFGIMLPFVAYLVDQKPPLQSHFLTCLFDNFGHGLIALLVWAPNALVGPSIFSFGILRFDIFKRHSVPLEISLAFFFGSVLDIDHFIAGGALSLKAATTLHSRPFGHSLLFIFLASVSLIMIIISSLSLSCPHLIAQALLAFIATNSRLGLLAFISTLSHQLRDSTRRGLWLWPFPHTPPLPYSLYLLLLALLPLTTLLLLERINWSGGSNGSLCSHESVSSLQERTLHIV